jgi:hypothetical protein
MVTLACLAATLTFAQDKNPVPKPPLITFAGLQKSDLDKGPFRIEGFVMQVYKCRPCPEGAVCKPCLGDHIVITDNLREKDPALIKRLRIFNKKPDDFAVGKKFSFLVKVRGKILAGRAVEDADLISSVPLRIKQAP